MLQVWDECDKSVFVSLQAFLLADVRRESPVMVQHTNLAAHLSSFPILQTGLQKYAERASRYHHLIAPWVQATLGYAGPSVATAFRDQEGWMLEGNGTRKYWPWSVVMRKYLNNAR